METRYRSLLTWGTVAGALAGLTSLRISVIDHLADQGFFDKYAYFARQILAGDWPLHRLADLSPGYLWTMVLMMGRGDLDYFGVRRLQIILVSLIALVCIWVAKKGWGWSAGVATGVLVLANRAALLNATDLEPETLVLACNTVGLGLLLGGRRPWTTAAAGCAFGISALFRPTALVAGLAVLLVLWWRRARHCDLRLLISTFPIGCAAGLVIPVLALKILYSAIPGATTLMNPGTVFYEGMNPLTTGLAGDAPAIVKDVEATLSEPDALHEAYRIVARRALGTSDQASTNHYWWTRSRAFMTHDPGAAAGILGRKLRLSVSNHDAWDLRTTVRKQAELQSPLWVGFGLLYALATVGAILTWGQREVPYLLAYLGVYQLIMVVFYVTARQRNPVLPALAILAGAGVCSLIREWRHDKRRKVIVAVAAVFLLTATLSIEGRVESEDMHTWDLHPATGDQADHDTISEAERFDTALDLMRDAQWRQAERLLAILDQTGYRPLRGALETSSVAYHRARCQLRTDPQAPIAGLLRRAENEAGPDPFVLALIAEWARTRTSDSDLVTRVNLLLEELYDPFTAGLARARALDDLGQHNSATQILLDVNSRIPEWSVPRTVLDRRGHEPGPPIVELPNSD